MKFRHKKIVLRSEVRDIGTACPSGLMSIRSELMRRLFWYRGIQDRRELDCSLANLLQPEGFHNQEAATELLSQAIMDDSRIVIVGDYDADGATATALSVRVLNAFGASAVRYVVPNRFTHGYGLSKELVPEVLKEQPELVITVDNGISSIEGVKALKNQGIRVLVTDHHLPGEELPEADAILNPNQEGCQFGSKNLAGVGVMFYLLIMVRRTLSEKGWFEKRGLDVPNLANYLDLVALGTVADVVPLDQNNRILVSQGLSRIRNGKCCQGILALLKISKRNAGKAVSADLGFAVAPRLNAAGRLTEISIGIECLLTDSEVKAKEYAARLDNINRERKKIEESMKAEALKMIGDLSVSDFTGLQKDPDVKHRICLYDAKFHQGLSGLIASRMKDQTGLPVVVFSRLNDGCLTGSARSINGLHIRDLLDRIACKNPKLIIRFGGHAMAAGLTIESERFEEFKDAYFEQVQAYLKGRGDIDTIETDGTLGPNEITLDSAQSILDVTTWGQAFPVPTFFGKFQVKKAWVVGDCHLKLRLAAKGRQSPIDAIVFNVIAKGEKMPPLKQIEAVYRLEVNEYKERRKLELLIDHFTPL